jgi:DNA processing protein
MDDPISWLTLALAPGLDASMLAGYLSATTSPTALLRESPATLRALGLRSTTIHALLRPDAELLSAGAEWLRNDARHSVVPWGSPGYPRLLALIPDPPLVLFVQGDAANLGLPQVAIVGSRNPTALGRDTACQFAEHLVRLGLGVTSGLALGIDAASHRGALRGSGCTIAVLGCGLDTVYPSENTALAAEIVANGGALVSDLPVGTPPLKHHFPRRNRIISGLAAGTLVVEAALQSGSLITARLAGEQGREVFAIPGSIHNPMARGCHRLLRQGAKLVESVEDILSELGPILGETAGFVTRSCETPSASVRPRLDKEYEILLDALGFQAFGLDALVARSGLKTEAVASMLLILELDGRIQQQPGGRYSRTLPGKVQ